jgi:hypothetical protein
LLARFVAFVVLARLALRGAAGLNRRQKGD